LDFFCVYWNKSIFDVLGHEILKWWVRTNRKMVQD
jgi:hypothetical protein